MTVEAALEAAERALAQVAARAPGAEVEVTVESGTAALTRFANSSIHQNVAEELSHVSVRVAVDGRVAASSWDGAPTEDALARLAQNVLDAARVRPPDPDWPGVADTSEAPDPGHWDDDTAQADPDARAAHVAGFVASADGLETAGACESEALTVAFANTAGQRLTGRRTGAALDGIARTGSSDGAARHVSARLADIDGARLGARAARKAREAADAADLEPGRYEVVLEPACVADLLQSLLVYGFNGRAVEEGRSFVRLGEQQFDEHVTLGDDVGDPAQVGIGFDAEGTPRRPAQLVERGVTRGLLHTRRTAARAGTDSTGHAVEGGDTIGALPVAPVLAPGTGTLEDLVGGVERGVLVTDLWYTRVLDPRTQVVTGLTRNGVWLIEGGRIVRPVSNLRFTQSYAEAVAPGAVKAVGGSPELVSGSYGAVYLVPPLHLASWNFTGGARG